MALIDCLDHGAQRSPQEVCLQMYGNSMSYAELQQFSHRLGNKLVALGLGCGDHASILSTNDMMAFACVFGLSRAGLTWVPANPKLSPDEVQYQLDFFDCKVLIFQSAFAELIDSIRTELPQVVAYVCLDKDLENAPSLTTWLQGTGPETCETVVQPDSLAMLMPTGGTTGRPKGVQLTNRTIATFLGTAMFCFSYRHDDNPVALIAAPITHAAGLLALPVIARGGRIVIISRPDLDEVIDTIEAEKVTELFLPPTVIYRLLDFPALETRDFSTLRYFTYGAAPMSVEKLKAAIRAFGPCLTQIFGQVEAPALCTFLSPRDHFEPNGEIGSDDRLMSCGYPTPLVDVKILDDDGNEVPLNEQGEICVKGDLVMTGYYKQPDKTGETIIDGWLHTGDIGIKDQAGRIRICDRKSDMIISGGFNIYPQEIEQVIWAHPAVQDCAVIGVPHEDWGESVKAVVELNAGASVSESELIALCRRELGSVRSPKSVDIILTLPRSPNGKVLKRELRDQYWKDRGRRI